jgi:ribose 5-phosphate isomerase A
VGELAEALDHVPGVVEHGLFLDMAERALLGRPDGSVDVLEASQVS